MADYNANEYSTVTLSLDEALAKFKAEVDNKTLFG